MSSGHALPRSLSDEAPPADPTLFDQPTDGPAMSKSARPTRFHSVLYPPESDGFQEGGGVAPDVLRDLNLDQVVDAITAPRREYALEPLFHSPLTDFDAVAYRQEVMRDMEATALRQAIATFARRLRTMRECLALTTTCYYDLERQRWHLAAAQAYTEAVEGLMRDLRGHDLASRGLRVFREDLASYSGSDAFRALALETHSLAAALAAVRYCMIIRGGTVTVRNYDGEIDFGAAVEETFRAFQKGPGRRYLSDFKDEPGLNHVEAKVLDRVALLNRGTFSALAQFCGEHADFANSMITTFDRDIQFYVAYLDYVDRFRPAGLPFCHPEITNRRSDIRARTAFDLALAGVLLRDKATIVCNDFFLQGAERVLVVTGPNQGGKTTFARLFGQLHYLASLGCPVPASEARLYLYDHLFTQFDREEDISNLRGKLEDELVRIRRILDQATPDSILIMNEVFSSTTVDDSLFLGREVLERIMRLDALCVWVTFLDELTTLGEKVVSMVAGSDPDDPAERTFRFERQPANGLACALALAEKHRVTHRWLRERIRK